MIADISVTSAKHSSPFGPMWSVWTDRGLYRLDWNKPPGTDFLPVNTEPMTRRHDASQSDVMNDFAERLDGFYREGRCCFDDIEIDPSGWTDFARRVYESARTIPAGNTVTYKQLAAMAGNEKASRAVGAAMARNRILLVIPCHRVIASSGELRGFSAAGGLQTKRKLLELEATSASTKLKATLG